MAEPVDPEPRATRLHERIAQVMLAHPFETEYAQWSCKCGWVWDGLPNTHHAHVASELERVVLEERQEWLRERLAETRELRSFRVMVPQSRMIRADALLLDEDGPR